MRLQQYINEEYFGRYGKWEVFKNPSEKELRQFKKVRFLLDDKKNLYIWDINLLHWDAWDTIIKPESGDYRKYDDFGGTEIFPGTGIVQGGKIKITESEYFDVNVDSGETFDKKYDEKVVRTIKLNFSWAKKYFTNWKRLFK